MNEYEIYVKDPQTSENTLVTVIETDCDETAMDMALEIVDDAGYPDEFGIWVKRC